MIVYREQKRTLATAGVVAALSAMRASQHDEIRDLLIAFGELECGVADALPYDHHAVLELRRIAVDLGRLFYRSHSGLPRRAARLTIPAGLPESIDVSPPEGYAFYCLFPETFLTACQQFIRDLQPHRCTVIGIRSIGASLSAAVAGALTEHEIPANSFTLRPTGHPFSRAARIHRPIDPDAFHLIVDEGPGLSGSSFASVATALSDAKVPDDRIVLFPSWIPDRERLLSPEARDRFARHRLFTAEFDVRLVRPDLPCWRDWSAGKWREDSFDSGQFPATHPQHERRKFLSPPRDTGHQILAKFAGFGSRGSTAYGRAQILHEAGFVPKPLVLKSGFLLSAFVPGRPVTRPSPALAERLADYLQFVQRAMPCKTPVPWPALSEMVAVNLSELLGTDAAPLLAMKTLIEDAPACQLDGRLFLHEWIETPSGFFKADAVDHADDHFFPGPQDIAWDIAAGCVELSLPDDFATQFGASVRNRLAFYKIAYSIFRLAYCRMAETSVPAEAPRFHAAAARYEAVTRESLAALRPSS